MMRQTAVGFYTRKLELEGVIASPSDGGAEYGAGVVVCHSHPMLGGDLDEAVVTAVCHTSVREGLVALRFNFRGVGKSQGEFSNGEQEHDDVKAALKLMKAWPGVDGGRVAVAGYSAGATIMLDGLRHLRGASALVLIAPTLGALRNRRFLKDKRPRLVVAGSEDRVAPSTRIQSVLDECRAPVQFHEIQGADHSMRGHQPEIGEVAAEFLVRNV